MGAVIAAVLFAILFFVLSSSDNGDFSGLTNNGHAEINHLQGKSFYIDQNREVSRLADKYRAEGNQQDAGLLDKISQNPGTVWLTGPTPEDPAATSDINQVKRTSAEASRQGTVPIYQLYAITDRDACAEYSQGGFKTSSEYLDWLDRILMSLSSEAVFSVEADAVGHMLQDGCMTPSEIADRQDLLRRTVSELHGHGQVIGIYLDGGHPEWFPNPDKLAEVLQKSGMAEANGAAVNVSFYADTKQVTEWSARLVDKLGGRKGIIIDTSRNGRGAPDQNAQGEARWCNPRNRGIGPQPTTSTGESHVHAYFWGKIIGESDGDCFGNPPAGVFVPELALELSRNAVF